jgi:hypothetical protein
MTDPPSSPQAICLETAIRLVFSQHLLVDPDSLPRPRLRRNSPAYARPVFSPGSTQGSATTPGSGTSTGSFWGSSEGSTKIVDGDVEPSSPASSYTSSQISRYAGPAYRPPLQLHLSRLCAVSDRLPRYNLNSFPSPHSSFSSASSSTLSLTALPQGTTPPVVPTPLLEDTNETEDVLASLDARTRDCNSDPLGWVFSRPAEPMPRRRRGPPNIDSVVHVLNVLTMEGKGLVRRRYGVGKQKRISKSAVENGRHYFWE